MTIHSTAVIDPGAELGDGVVVGPYAVVGAGVVTGAGCRIGPHACLLGPLELGAGCEVGFSAALGHDPQVKGRPGPFGRTRIGARCVFREFAQVHRSMKPEAGTVIGDDAFLMTNAHVAHDCVVGDHVVLSTNAALGGHVVVGDRANLGGGAMVAQFRRVGELAMVAGMAPVHRDVPPFSVVSGMWPVRLRGLNLVGLRRAGVSRQSQAALKAAFRILFDGEGNLEERLARVEAAAPEVQRLVAFLGECGHGVIGVQASP